MLTVKIIQAVEPSNRTVYLSSYDIQLVKDIRDKIGKVSAVKVFRLMTKCSLKEAVDYVNGMEG